MRQELKPKWNPKGSKWDPMRYDGRRFGTRTVIGPVTQGPNKRVRTVCTCGNREYLRLATLKKGEKRGQQGCPRCRTQHGGLRYAEVILGISPSVLDLAQPCKRWVLGALLSGRTHASLAEELGISQPSVTQIIATTLHRCVEYNIGEIPSFEETRAFLQKHVRDPATRACLEGMYLHQQQTKVANLLGRSQGYVRHRCLLGLKQLPADHKVSRWLALPFRSNSVWVLRDPVWAKKLGSVQCPTGEDLHAQARACFAGVARGA